MTSKCKNWTDLTAEKLTELKTIHGNWTEVAKILDTSAANLYLIRKKLGENVDPSYEGDQHDRIRHYNVDETFFEKIDTERKAYWLGWITGDGFLKGEYGFALQLSRKDENILEMLKKDLKSDHPISQRVCTKKNKSYPVSEIAIYSKKIVQDLQILGILKDKTWSAHPCVLVPDDQRRHYWRGMIDADGTVVKTKGRKTSKSFKWRIRLVGTTAIVEGFSSFIYEKIGHKSNIKPHGSIFKTEYNGVPLPQKVANLIWGDAEIFLGRKAERIAELLAAPNQRKSYDHITKEMLLQERSLGKSWYRIAKENDLDQWTLFNIGKKFDLR